MSTMNITSRLLQHMRDGKGGKKEAVQCKFCKKPFNSANVLKLHERKHGGDSPYRCEVCQRGFNCDMLLKSHAIVHQQTKTAEDCEQSPWEGGDEGRRRKTPRKFNCDVCGKQFGLFALLQSHHC